MIRVFEKGEPLALSLPRGARVAVKPNLTYTIYKEGVTTSPRVIETVVDLLVREGNDVTIVESDGGYGAWDCDRALRGHGIPEIAGRLGAKVLNLTASEWTHLDVRKGRTRIRLPFPKAILDRFDAFISMPVPKVHCMTGVTLAMKNQWGLVPDPLRLNFHYAFNEAILEINRRLPHASVIGDGTYFLDGNGPMDGVPIRKNLIISADSIGEFDRYLCAMMGVDPGTIPHLRHAIAEGFVPADLSAIDYDPERLERHRYTASLRRTPRNWLVLGFFRSKWLTHLMYTSALGRVLHRGFYAVVGHPTPP